MSILHTKTKLRGLQLIFFRKESFPGLFYPELLEKYNKAFDEQREKIQAFKGGLTVNSIVDDIDSYNQMRFRPLKIQNSFHQQG